MTDYRKEVERFHAEAEAEAAERAEGASLIRAKAELAAARKQRDQAMRQVKALEEEIGVLGTELSLYARSYQGKPGWVKKPKDTKKHKATLVSILSDTHYGEFVDAAQMDGYNAFDLDIATARTRRWTERVVKVARHYIAGVEFDGFVLVLGGDTVSGTIHDELVRTNELGIYESIEFGVELLIPAVEMLATEFGKIHVVSVPGNHGRSQRKPEAKDYAADNADSHIARLLARHFGDEKDITFQVPVTADADFEVYGWRFSTEHGHELQRAFAGSAEIGSLGPIARGTLRKSTQKLAEGKPFDYHLLGHFHQYIPAASKGFIVNGSLKGYDEFARQRKFKPEPPQQALMVVTPEFGVSQQAPIFVADRDAEGW